MLLLQQSCNIFSLIIQKEKETFYEQRKNDFKPFIPADKVMPEFTPTALILGIILAVVFELQMLISDLE